jgi:hypothetical protein
MTINIHAHKNIVAINDTNQCLRMEYGWTDVQLTEYQDIELQFRCGRVVMQLTRERVPNYEYTFQKGNKFVFFQIRKSRLHTWQENGLAT